MPSDVDRIWDADSLTDCVVTFTRRATAARSASKRAIVSASVFILSAASLMRRALSL